MKDIGGRQRGPTQRVIDPGHRCNYSQVPHLLLEDAAAGKLRPSSVVLYLHYLRVAFELHGEPLVESLRVTKRRTGLSNGTILTARGELAAAGWVDVQEQGDGEVAIVTLVERWDSNCHGHAQHSGQKLTTPGQKLTASGQKPAASGRKLTTAHLKTRPFKTEDLEDPYGGASFSEDEGARGETDQLLPGMLTPIPRGSAALLSSDKLFSAEDLLDSFYRDGLGVDPAQHLTSKQRDREMENGQELCAIGATPEEAAAWARETIDEGQIKFVTLAAFVKARPAWVSQRRPSRTPVSVINYEHDPWQNKRPPIAEADLARGAAL